MPDSFKESFVDKVTTKINCFEVFVENPSNLCSSAECWSNYKHHKTIKNFIVVSPQGSIIFVSEGYGGRTSDKFITENCGFLDKISPGDVILTDRGFTITESIEFRGAKVNIPAFTKGVQS